MKLTNAILVISGLLLVSFVRGEEAVAGWHPDVKRLLSPEERDEALQKLLKEGGYPKSPLYNEKRAGKIKDVVRCLQPPGKPLIAVFAEEPFGRVDVPKRSGHLIIIRSDGVIIPFYKGANSPNGNFEDLNGDGIVDSIDSWEFGYEAGLITGLHLVPITEQFKPALVVYWKEGDFAWRLDKSDPFGISAVQIFATKPVRLEVVAEYKWSEEKKRWLGPAGSLKEGFLRVDGDPDENVKQLLNLKAKQAGNGQPANRPESKSEGGHKPQPDAEGRTR